MSSVSQLTSTTPDQNYTGANGTDQSSIDLFDNISTTPLCTNQYCLSDEDYVDSVYEHIFPTAVEWIFICLHIAVFIAGLFGNSLVFYVVVKHRHMRTVTNLLIMNLAVADFLVILICLPPTLLHDTMETWFVGEAMCKIVIFLQTVSVSVSVLTLTSISFERYCAICYPLKFINSTRKATATIFLIWVIAMLAAIPDLLYMGIKPYFTGHYSYLPLLIACMMQWNTHSIKIYQIFQMVVFYFLPMGLMGYAYLEIAQRLWTNVIPGNRDSYNKVIYEGSHMNQETQLSSRRKAAKMLIAIVVLFGLCYLPVYLLNILRYAKALDLMRQDTIPIFALVAHWLCYFNSSINPVIYNFMSAKFRKEFRSILTCCRSHRKRKFRRPSGGYMYKFASTFRRTEHVNLTSLSTRQHYPSGNGCQRTK